MAKVTIQEVASLADPLTSDLFELVFGNIPGGVGDKNKLRIQCQQISLPAKSIEPVQVDLHAHTLMFAGRMTFSHDLSITFVEDNKMSIFNALNGWAEYTRNKRNQLGNYKADYSTTADLYVYDQTGLEIRKFQLHGLWISGVPEYQFDGSAANLITASASFQMDWWE